MHIALCDDNVADRKQFERLIKRESDKRASKEEVLFLDSFGNAQTLLANPMQYDVFFIDLCHTPDMTGADIVHSLIAHGVKAPIVLCCSQINYRAFQFPENISFLDKPIQSDALSECISHVVEILQHAVHMIELRSEGGTYYLTEPDLLYAVQNGIMMDVHLHNGQIISVLDTASNLFSQLSIFPVFFSPTKKTVINGRYIERFKFRKAVMADGKELRIEGAFMPYARKIYMEYHSD